ncbi:hypothetical protein Hanom_Chr02g00116211 [Helianthus anomalus]
MHQSLRFMPGAQYMNQKVRTFQEQSPAISKQIVCNKVVTKISLNMHKQIFTTVTILLQRLYYDIFLNNDLGGCTHKLYTLGDFQLI